MCFRWRKRRVHQHTYASVCVSCFFNIFLSSNYLKKVLNRLQLENTYAQIKLQETISTLSPNPTLKRTLFSVCLSVSSSGSIFQSVGHNPESCGTPSLPSHPIPTASQALTLTLEAAVFCSSSLFLPLSLFFCDSRPKKFTSL